MTESNLRGISQSVTILQQVSQLVEEMVGESDSTLHQYEKVRRVIAKHMEAIDITKTSNMQKVKGRAKP